MFQYPLVGFLQTCCTYPFLFVKVSHERLGHLVCVLDVVRLEQVELPARETDIINRHLRYMGHLKQPVAIVAEGGPRPLNHEAAVQPKRKSVSRIRCMALPACFNAVLRSRRNT